MVTYCTVDQVEAELRATSEFASTTIPSLAQVTDWIDEESAQIDYELGYSIASTQYDEVYDYNTDEDKLFTRVSPIISVDTLLYNTTSIGNTGYSTGWVEKTENTDFFVKKDRGEIPIISTNWLPKDGVQNIRLIYTAGYSTTPEVYQKLATKLVAQRVLNTLIQNNINEGNDGGSISVGSINIVEPESYGVNSYRELANDIADLKTQITQGFGVHRYSQY